MFPWWLVQLQNVSQMGNHGSSRHTFVWRVMAMYADAAAREGKQLEIKEPVTCDNPPEVWINELVEREDYMRANARNNTPDAGDEKPNSGNEPKRPKRKKQGTHNHTTPTIRTICKHYAWFPHVRSQPIKLPGCSARLYKYAFRSFRQFKHDRPHYDGR